MEGRKKYQELVAYLKKCMEDGTLKPGDRLSSENELSAMFEVSRQTVRRAVGLLEEEGLVRRVRGSGTYLSGGMTDPGARKRIAVITTYVDTYIFPKTIQGIERILFGRGYSVQLYFTDNRVEREKEVLRDLIVREDVAGVIAEGTKSGLPNPNLGLYRKLQARHIPILFINTYYPELEAPHVSLNDELAAQMAVSYLIAQGHRSIGAILKLDDGQGRLRYLGYIKALEHAGLKLSDSRMVWIDTDESKQLSLSMDRICNRLEQCTAVLCYNDQIAFQLIHLLTGRGIQVPGQLSVISIDDSDLALHCEIPITSLPHPKEKLGEKAAETLLAMLSGRTKALTHEFDTRVIERSTVAKPPL